MPVRKEEQEGTVVEASKAAPQKRAAKAAPKQTTNRRTDIEVDESKGSVSYSVSITKNTGKYESVKIQAGITVPFGASDEMLKELDDLLVVTRETVVARLSGDLADITNSLK